MNLEKEIFDIHEDIGIIKGNMNLILSKLQDGKETFDNHETRIRSIEEGWYIFIGKFSIISAGVIALFALLFNFVIRLWMG